MASRQGLFSSSVGTKILIGLTGFLLFLYLLIHIAGNLVVFLGPEAFNKYAYAMEEQNPVLPAIELALLLVFVIHIYKTLRMFLSNQTARPIAYRQKKSAGYTSRKSLSSTTMIVSGLWLLIFLLVHVKAFRFQPSVPLATGGRDLYRLEFEALSNPLVAAFYILSMVIVGSHLWHGISSALQSLGADHPKWTPRFLLAGKIFAVAIAGAFMVIAAWVYLNQGRVHA